MAIIRSEDYFKLDHILQQKKQEYHDYLERNLILERELSDIKLKLKIYANRETKTKIKLQELKKEFQELESNYKKKKLELENKLNNKTKELMDAKKEIESKEAIINELKEEGIFRKITGIFPGKNHSGKNKNKNKNNK